VDPNFSIVFGKWPIPRFPEGRYCEVELTSFYRKSQLQKVDFLVGVTAMSPEDLRGVPPAQAHLLQKRWLFECGIHALSNGTLGILYKR